MQLWLWQFIFYSPK